MPASARLYSTSHSSDPKGSSKAPRSRRRGIIATALVAGAAGWAWLFIGFGAGGGSGDVYPSKFTPFTVTAREQVSPTAFILTIRNDQPKEAAINPTSVRHAWQHGLWSVEIKQPQLQIARHYTPLPPSPAHPETEDNNELRFLIRKMDTGEMSNYLSRKEVGDQIWLRGPHLGFDVSRRLGSAQQVVFLAGGTGIAPALQVVHRLLENKDAAPAQDSPTISILWANRHRVDALGRQHAPRSSGSSWGSWWTWMTGSGKPTTSDATTPSTMSFNSSDLGSLSRQILEMKQKYGSKLHVEYFVDDEKTFINQDSVTAALVHTNTTKNKPVPVDSSRCIWHSPALLERLTGDNDVDRAKDPNHASCACSSSSTPTHITNTTTTDQSTGGKNLLFVSGPDGFIRAYAGSKWWHGGMEMQGPVRGLAQAMMMTMKTTTNGGSMMPKDEWLVLKL